MVAHKYQKQSKNHMSSNIEEVVVLDVFVDLIRTSKMG